MLVSQGTALQLSDLPEEVKASAPASSIAIAAAAGGSGVGQDVGSGVGPGVGWGPGASDGSEITLRIGLESLASLKQALEAPEREIIRHALERCGGNRKKTAALLAVNRTTLFNKMKKYGLMGREDGRH